MIVLRIFNMVCGFVGGWTITGWLLAKIEERHSATRVAEPFEPVHMTFEDGYGFIIVVEGRDRWMRRRWHALECIMPYGQVAVRRQTSPLCACYEDAVWYARNMLLNWYWMDQLRNTA